MGTENSRKLYSFASVHDTKIHFLKNLKERQECNRGACIIRQTQVYKTMCGRCLLQFAQLSCNQNVSLETFSIFRKPKTEENKYFLYLLKV